MLNEQLSETETYLSQWEHHYTFILPYMCLHVRAHTLSLPKNSILTWTILGVNVTRTCCWACVLCSIAAAMASNTGLSSGSDADHSVKIGCI